MRVKIGGDYKDIATKELREKGVSYVYMIKNLENNRVYIGESVDPVRRFKHHRYKKDWVNYDNCELIILEETTISKSLERERYYIEKYNAVEDGYNQRVFISSNVKYMDKSKKLNQESADNLRRDFKNGMKRDDIFDKYNISGFTLSRVIKGEAYTDSDYAKNYKVENRLSFLTDEDADNIRLEYISGKSMDELMDMYDVSKSAISLILNYETHKDSNVNVEIDTSSMQLTREEANIIRELYSKGDITFKELSNDFDVGYHAIRYVIYNETHYDPNYKYKKQKRVIKHSEETIKEVKEIRRLYKTGDYTQAELGNMFKRSRGSVGEIVRRENYKNI